MRLRFTIRDWLWLVTVLALTICVWIERQERQHTDLIYRVQRSRNDALRNVMARNPKATAALLHTCPDFDALLDEPIEP